MLERTAACLESRTLRRLLPSSSSLKSRRALHSTFWNHAAGPLESSPLWSVLVQGSASSSLEDGIHARHESLSVGGGLFLDFLYPTSTANLLRKYTSWVAEQRHGRRKRSQWKGLGRRLYSSSAQDYTFADQPFGGSYKTAEIDNEVCQLVALMSRDRDCDYDACWRIFTRLDADSRQQLTLTFLEYLSTSDRAIDAERIVQLFSVLDCPVRRAETYGAVIQASLRLGNSELALQTYNIAAQNLIVPTPSSHLLVHFVDKGQWDGVTRLWITMQKLQVQLDHKLLAAFNRLPDLGVRACHYALHLEELNRTQQIELGTSDASLKTFAIALIKQALFHNTSMEEKTYLELLETLKRWDFATSGLLNGVLRQLMATKRTKLASKVYFKFHPDRTIKLAHSNLYNMLEIMCYNGNVLGMRAVLEDYFHFHQKPPLTAYRRCMIEFASQGDAATVHALFDQLKARHRSDYNISTGDFQPILHVHALRGEINEVIKNFRELQTTYGGRPNITCWNILINAYGKVNDIDSAMDCFESILASKEILPNHYTFGTIMSICASRGDAELTMQAYRLAEKLNIQKSAAMVDCLVYAHIQNGQLLKAEEICEDSLSVRLSGTVTRMWNSLIVAHALRRDLVNVNRIVQRMIEAKVPCDAYTYSALMQLLAMIKQPDRAYDILTKVMPEAGIRPNQFHYSVAMGAFLRIGNTMRVFHLRDQMMRAGFINTAKTNLFAIKAAVIEDQKILNTGTPDEQLARAMEIFNDVVDNVKFGNLADTGRTDTNRMPRPLVRSSMLYSYLLFVLGQSNEFETVEVLYARYRKLLSAHQQDVLPLEILSAMMSSYLRQGNHDAVAQCWSLSIARAKEQGKPLSRTLAINSNVETTLKINPTIHERPKIISSYQLALNNTLTFYMESLSAQSRTEELPGVVNDLLEDGFLLDNINWNRYVQFMAKKYRWRVAFDTCEKILMPNWTGWQQIRRELPVRNRLPIGLRALRKSPTHYRPKTHTLLYLAKAYLELQAAAAESKEIGALLTQLLARCPKTINAIRTMRRSDNELQREVLGGE